MKCSVCNDYTLFKGNEFNDCIIEFLEKIKFHYTSFKSKLNDSEETVEKLKTTNTNLLQTIEKLKCEINAVSPNVRKRRKTNSLDSTSDGADECPNVQAILPDKSTDDLNEALNEENWDDTFFVPPTQTQSDEKPEEKPINIPKPDEACIKELDVNTYRLDVRKSPRVLSLSPKDRLVKQITPLKMSPEETVLPRRNQVKSNKKIAHNETKNIGNTSNWISKEQSAKKNPATLEKCWTMSFLQPIKSGDVKNKNSSFVDVSPNDQKENRSPLATRDANRLRQTKLNFNPKKNEKHAIQFDDTYCEDLVAASPTSLNIASNETGKLSKMLSLRKITRQKADNSVLVSPKKNSSSLSPEIGTESIGRTPTKSKIKTEPVTVKKNVKSNLFPRIPLSPAKSDPGATLCSQDDSSVFVLPSQPDDVICLEETDEPATSSVSLLEEMMDQKDNFSDILWEIEAKQKSKIEKDKQLKIENAASDKFQTPENQKKLLTFDCKECEAYFKYIGKDLSENEVERRLRNCCKHKKPISLHHTPEGFWDPYFRPLPPDDPRNETLIDTRFVDKKK